jgi:hypothetical protein
MTDFSELVKGYGNEPKSSTLATSYEQPCNPSATASPALERFSLADLERMSVIVPDLSALRKGDILVRKSVAELGIVVHLPAVTAAMQADWSLLLNEVIVVTVRPAFRQATLGTWGNRGMSFGGFTTDPKGFMVRRLLIDSGAPYVAKNPNAIDPAWNLTSPVIDPAASTFRIAAMYEHTRVSRRRRPLEPA